MYQEEDSALASIYGALLIPLAGPEVMFIISVVLFMTLLLVPF